MILGTIAFGTMFTEKQFTMCGTHFIEVVLKHTCYVEVSPNQVDINSRPTSLG